MGVTDLTFRLLLLPAPGWTLSDPRLGAGHAFFGAMHDGRLQGENTRGRLSGPSDPAPIQATLRRLQIRMVVKGNAKLNVRETPPAGNPPLTR